jgi:hypothetical protein
MSPLLSLQEQRRMSVEAALEREMAGKQGTSDDGQTGTECPPSNARASLF